MRFIASFLTLAFLLAGRQGLAQPYQWTHSFDASAECVAFNPLSNGKTIFWASIEYAGIMRSDDGGLTWKEYGEGMLEFSSAHINQVFCLESDTNIVMAVSTSEGIYRSTNGGRKWSLALEPGGILGEAITWHRPSDVLYYGQNYKGPVWKSIDHGATWIQNRDADENAVLCTIAISNDDRRIILAGSGEGGIALTHPAGPNDTLTPWRSVYQMEDSNEIIRPEIPKIIWSEHAKDVVLATRWLSKENHLIRSTDAGETWQTISLGQPRAWGLEVDQSIHRIGPNGPQRFWVGLFNRGLEPNDVNSIIETLDGGKTWLSSGLPEVQQVWMIKYDTASQTLVAATNLGIYVAHAFAGVQGPGFGVRGAYLTSNPASSVSQVTVPANDRLNYIEVLDMSGRLMITSTDPKIDVAGLANGVYLVKASTSKQQYLLRLVVSH